MVKTILIISQILLSGTILAQENIALSNEKIHAELNLMCPVKTYNDNNIDLRKYNDFLSLGLDLKKERYPGYRERLLFCDNVIIGKVVERVYDTIENVMYHTILKVKVIDNILGDIDNEFIYIYDEAGSLGGDKYIWISHNTTLDLGEKSLIYLAHLTRGNYDLQQLFGKNVIFNVKDEFSRNFTAIFKVDIRNKWWMQECLMVRDSPIRLKKAIRNLKAIASLYNN